MSTTVNDQSIGFGRMIHQHQDLAAQEREEALARADRHRPTDKSARAIQNALDVVTGDLAAAKVRVERCQDAASTAMASGTPAAKVMAARDARDLAAIEVEQLEGMAAGLRVSLLRAQEAEAQELIELAARVPAAEAAIVAFNKFVATDYPRHAAAIAKGLALERDAEAAHGVLRSAAIYLPNRKGPDDLPRVANGTLTEAYRHRCCLPGTDVRPGGR